MEERINKIEEKVFNGEMAEIREKIIELHTNQVNIIETIEDLRKQVQQLFYIITGGVLITIFANFLIRIIFGH